MPLAIVCGAVLLLAVSSFGQVNTGPADTAKSFYKWYLHELNAEREPINNKPKMRTFISDRLARWIGSKAYEEYGADYFIDAQDFGEAWEHNIQISRVVTSGSSATLRITLIQPKTGNTPNIGNKILDLRLLKERGVWKIDRITGKH
jgi:hypothetical protein